MRAAARTEPGRLWIIGTVVALLVVAFGGVTAWEISDRSAAASDVVNRSQPLSADAASIYRSLADADTAAASGFLAGGQEPLDVRKRYDTDIATASRLLVKAAANTTGSAESAQQIATLNEQLPLYNGLVEQARANNRQGFPVGGAYLRFANQKMSTSLLPAAQKLYEAETGRLYDDYDQADTWPYAATALGLVALGGLVWVQRRNFLRTNRVFNHGLLAATAASTVVLLWLVVGHAVASSDLSTSRAHGQESLKVLNDARISSLQARANENLTLVARGAVLKDGKDVYEASFTQEMASLTDKLGAAKKLADDDAGKTPVVKAVGDMDEWQKRHTAARKTDDSGDYEGALTQVLASKGSTGECFDQVDQALDSAIAHEQRQFTAAASDGRGALTGLPLGAAVLAVLAAAAAGVGISRRLAEYR
uniref:Secreted protein n=1 Tax=Streptomyces sp. NBC_00003 TaxID=2903608 RepID=A0AAU2VJ19_9ACTN